MCDPEETVVGSCCDEPAGCRPRTQADALNTIFEGADEYLGLGERWTRATFCRSNLHQRKNDLKPMKQKREKHHTTTKSIFRQHADPTRARTSTEHGSNAPWGRQSWGHRTPGSSTTETIIEDFSIPPARTARYPSRIALDSTSHPRSSWTYLRANGALPTWDWLKWRLICVDVQRETWARYPWDDLLAGREAHGMSEQTSNLKALVFRSYFFVVKVHDRMLVLRPADPSKRSLCRQKEADGTFCSVVETRNPLALEIHIIRARV
ncbi:hypothetical protein BDV93DRAFT_578607 [Ceratobasidium sp. AG-I]|nr:hypothetical protein BDV93DRAFT_578607 [Ceratobasidium sp. AG-I]